MPDTATFHLFERNFELLCDTLHNMTMLLAEVPADGDLVDKICAQRATMEAMAIECLSFTPLTREGRDRACSSGSAALLSALPLPAPEERRSSRSEPSNLIGFLRHVGPDYLALWLKHQLIEGSLPEALITLAAEDRRWTAILAQLIESPIFRDGVRAHFAPFSSEPGLVLHRAIKAAPEIVPRLLSLVIERSPVIGQIMLDGMLVARRLQPEHLRLLWAVGVPVDDSNVALKAVLDGVNSHHLELTLLTPCSQTLKHARQPLGVPADPLPNCHAA